MKVKRILNALSKAYQSYNKYLQSMLSLHTAYPGNKHLFLSACRHFYSSAGFKLSVGHLNLAASYV